MRKTVFIKNAAVLTASSVILRLLGIVFKIWVAAKVGSEGMGLYSLVFSVYVLFGAFASAGLCTAATRLCANDISLCRDYRPSLKKCAVLTLVISVFSSAVMLVLCRPLSRLSVGDSSVFLCFAVLSLSLPAIGFSSLFRGYFLAVRKVKNSAFLQIAEQVIRIVLSYFLVVKFIKRGAAAACLALVIGDTAAEILSCLLLFLRYKKTSEKLILKRSKNGFGYKDILRIAFPLTAGRYLALLLRTAENLLIPRSLAKSGITNKSSLSFFGAVKGMALPVLLFPSGILNAVSLLLVPEISSSLVQKRFLVVRQITEKTVKITMVISSVFACLFANLGNMIGEILYKNNEVGFLLAVLSPIVPLMYLDAVADGILKGLDCQKFSFFVGISDSALRLIAILFFLPRYGVTAFLIIMYGSNFFTAFLNTSKLLKKSGAQIDMIKCVFIPLCSALVITKAAALSLRNVAAINPVLYLAAVTVLSLGLYFACLLLLECVTVDEIKDVFC